MYCSKCGTQCDENGNCPNCGIPHVEAERVNKTKEKRTPSKGSKSFAALLTAAMVFPATVSVAIDLSFSRYDYWCGFVVGALLVFWVCAVLPALKITPAPVTSLICFVSIVGYVCYVCKKLGWFDWLFQKAMPLFILLALFIAIDVALFGGKKISGLTGVALISGEIAVYLIAIELICRDRPINFHLLPIFACGFISVSAVLLAFEYIGKINKK